MRRGIDRRRRRRVGRRPLGLALLGLLVVAAAAAGHRIGVTQTEVERARRDEEVAQLDREVRILNERVAQAEQRAESVIAREARLRQTYTREVPQGDLRRLVALLEQRLRGGVPVDRLALVLEQVRVEPRCEPGIISQRLPVHTATSTEPLASAAFLDNRIIVTGEGKARQGAGPEAPFDAATPAVFRFLEIGGEVSTAAGVVPLSHVLVTDGRQYQFVVSLTTEPGVVAITMRSCLFP